MEFKLHSEYKLTGDQPQAIEKLVKGIMDGKKPRHYLALRVQVKPLQWQI